jgi:acetyl esterase/lipase
MAPDTIVRTMRYGSDPSQFARLHLPRYDSDLPVVVVVHGGFWRQRYDIELADPLADDLAKHGFAGVAVEYRRVGDGGRGGWPQTLMDVANAVDNLPAAGQYLARGRLDLSRVAAVGHSAGGHLVGWLAHRGALREATPGRTTPGDDHLPLRGVVSQAGVLDLVGASDERLGDGAVIDLMEGSAGSVPQRYQHASPLAHVGDGARVVCVHGDADDEVPLSQSERYVQAAQAAGDPAELITLPGVGHYELIDPAHHAWEVCREQLSALLSVGPGGYGAGTV